MGDETTGKGAFAALLAAAERRGYERGVREAAAVCAEVLGCYPKALLALLDDERADPDEGPGDPLVSELLGSGAPLRPLRRREHDDEREEE